MDLTEIKEHYETFQEWLQSLNSVDDLVWLSPIAEGKWSIAAIISHLYFWDKYSFNERFPYFLQGAELERFPDFQNVNNEANEFAHSGISKTDIIQNILDERHKYFHLIEQYDEASLNISFSIGNHSLTVADYFKDFIEHDLHHQKQVLEAIKTLSR